MSGALARMVLARGRRRRGAAETGRDLGGMPTGVPGGVPTGVPGGVPSGVSGGRPRERVTAAPGSVGVADESGSVTAEFAAVVPAVVAMLILCLAGVQAVGQQVRMTDAAADGARTIARGDSAALAAERVDRSIGGVSLGTSTRGDFVCVHLTAPSAFGPAGALGLTVTATSCALAGGQ